MWLYVDNKERFPVTSIFLIQQHRGVSNHRKLMHGVVGLLKELDEGLNGCFCCSPIILGRVFVQGHPLKPATALVIVVGKTT